MLFSLFLLAGLSGTGLPSGSSEPLVDSLYAVTVTADRGAVVSRSDTLDVGNSISITDVLRQSTSLYVGDNGGYAGLKTVSLRGMGSAHTAIYMDGVRIGNVQSGKGDLGMLDFENLSHAVVDYAQNSISFNTARPEFTDSKMAGKAGIGIGSFGTYLPSARFDFKLSDRLALSVNAAGIISKGDFPLADGSVRLNNDIKQVRGGINLFGTMDDGEYHIKAFGNTAERGTPGSISWPSEDR
jgi:hypothetical protein